MDENERNSQQDDPKGYSGPKESKIAQIKGTWDREKAALELVETEGIELTHARLVLKGIWTLDQAKAKSKKVGNTRKIKEIAKTAGITPEMAADVVKGKISLAEAKESSKSATSRKVKVPTTQSDTDAALSEKAKQEKEQRLNKKIAFGKIKEAEKYIRLSEYETAYRLLSDALDLSPNDQYIVELLDNVNAELAKLGKKEPAPVKAKKIDMRLVGIEKDEEEKPVRKKEDTRLEEKKAKHKKSEKKETEEEKVIKEDTRLDELVSAGNAEEVPAVKPTKVDMRLEGVDTSEVKEEKPVKEDTRLDEIERVEEESADVVSDTLADIDEVDERLSKKTVESQDVPQSKVDMRLENMDTAAESEPEIKEDTRLDDIDVSDVAGQMEAVEDERLEKLKEEDAATEDSSSEIVVDERLAQVEDSEPVEKEIKEDTRLDDLTDDSGADLQSEEDTRLAGVESVESEIKEDSRLAGLADESEEDLQSEEDSRLAGLPAAENKRGRADLRLKKMLEDEQAAAQEEVEEEEIPEVEEEVIEEISEPDPEVEEEIEEPAQEYMPAPEQEVEDEEEPEPELEPEPEEVEEELAADVPVAPERDTRQSVPFGYDNVKPAALGKSPKEDSEAVKAFKRAAAQWLKVAAAIMVVLGRYGRQLCEMFWKMLCELAERLGPIALRELKKFGAWLKRMSRNIKPMLEKGAIALGSLLIKLGRTLVGEIGKFSSGSSVVGNKVTSVLEQKVGGRGQLVQVLVVVGLVLISITTFSARVMGLKLFPTASKMADASMIFDNLRHNLNVRNFPIATKQVNMLMNIFHENQVPVEDYINAGNLLYSYGAGDIYKNSYYALQFYEKSLDMNPADEHRRWILFQIGNCNYRLALYTRAIYSYEQILSRYPNNSRVDQILFKIGSCFDKLGFYDQSRKYYSQLVEQYPKSEFAQDAIFAIANSFRAQSQGSKNLEEQI